MGYAYRRGSDSEDVARRGRARWLDVEEAPPCGRLADGGADRDGIEERHRRSGYGGGFRASRFGDKRREGGGVVAADGRGEPRTRRPRVRCVVASHRTVMVLSRGAGTPQFTGKRPDGSSGQHRHDQQRRCAEHCLAPKRASAVPSSMAKSAGKSAVCQNRVAECALDSPWTTENSPPRLRDPRLAHLANLRNRNDSPRRACNA